MEWPCWPPPMYRIDLVAELEREGATEAVNATLKEAAEGPFKGIMAYSGTNRFIRPFRDPHWPQWMPMSHPHD